MTSLKKSGLEAQGIEAEVLGIIRALLVESGLHRAVSQLSPGAGFERDLGLGSLERVELLIRIEAAFSISLPDTTIAEAQTPRELARLVMKAAPLETKRYYASVPALEGLAFPMQPASTLCEALSRKAEAYPDRPHIYLPSETEEETVVTYGDLFKGAQGIARRLQAWGLLPGETVALMLPTDRSFFETFFGVLFAGGIPVPVYPPFRPDRIEEYARRQTRILRNAEVVFLVAFQAVEGLAQLLRSHLPALRTVITAKDLSGADGEVAMHQPFAKESDPALIQYTSGSTGDPKGVLLTHRNLIANIRSIGQALQVRPEDAGVSWLPLYHDMGLIGAWFLPLYYGIPVTILPPFAFLSRPERWLWAIHSHRATISPAPNFAYEVCAGKIRDAAIEGLDLGSWRIALNGAEPVKPETLDRFTKRFAPYGFRAETHFPVYGMAEASVGLAFPQLGAPPRIDRVSRERFERDREAIPADASETAALSFVSCGRPLPGHEIRIVDEMGNPVSDRIEGTLIFRGPSCTSGYYRNPEANAALFQDGWLVSGDLAYIADGDLFITGRQKDLIIKGGRNLHPHDIESVAENISGVRKGCVAAFGVPDSAAGTEKLVVVAETRQTQEAIRSEIVDAIHAALVETLGMPADQVFLAIPGSIPKTSSGKIARSRSRAAYLEGRLSKRRRVGMQLTRLAAASLWRWFRRGVHAVGRVFYGVYLAALLTPHLLLLRGMLRFLPDEWAGGMVRKGARLFLRLAGLFPHVSVEGIFEKTGPSVMVANHASYADALLLTAVLPVGVRFVAKQELLKVPILRGFLRMGGHITVDRRDVSKGTSEMEAIVSILREGGRVLIFPEGTFRATAGLRPFKLGAFKAAVETGAPVFPVSLEGSRQLLRDNQWLPRRRRVRIRVGPPIVPQDRDWREIVRIRDLARKEIAHHCKERVLE
ncbi:MAG: AMP-binding protein [Nitrospiria bacterium]